MNITDKTTTITKKEQKTNKQSNWTHLINGIIRPPRSNYKQTQLGAKHFILNETQYERLERTVAHHDKTLLLTIYEPEYKNGWLILYLHGNSSSRLQATSIIRYLPHLYSLACFDFMGCGLNYQMDTISLGHRESLQTETVVKYLQNSGYKVILWGRSMGAVTALKYGKAPIIISDSAFCSFKKLCMQVAKRNAPNYFPDCLINCLFPCVFCKLRGDIEKKGQYDIETLDTQQAVKNINPQTLIVFMSGDQDTLIEQKNSQKLYESFPGPKKFLQIFKGTHNTKRPQQTLRKVMRIIKQHIEDYDKNLREMISRTKIDVQIDQFHQ